MAVDIALRLGLQGGREVERTLDQIGRKGKAALGDITVASKDLPPSMVAVSRSVAAARDGVDNMAARTGALGDVLGSFGGAGVAAAAGLAAVGMAAFATFNQLRAGMQFADELGDTAERIGVTTDTLQEFQFAATAAGAEADQVAQAFEGFNRAFGSARSGLSERAMRPFEALGFTQDELKSVTSINDILPQVIERISQLGSTAEQAAVAEKLGLTPLLPVIQKGSTEIARLREEAHRLGYVMDRETVESLGKANDEFETASRVISTQLKSSLAGLAPVIISVMNLIVRLSQGINDLFTTTQRERAEAMRDEGLGDLDRATNLNDRARRIRAGGFDAFVAGGVRALTAAGRQTLASDLETEASKVFRDAQATLSRAAEMFRAAEARSPDVPAIVDGTNLFDTSGDTSKKDTARADLERDLSQLRRQLMSEEERAAAALADQLALLDRARAAGLIASDAERDALQALARQRAGEAAATKRQAEAERFLKETREAVDRARTDAAEGVASIREQVMTAEQWRAREIARLRQVQADASAAGVAGLAPDEEARALAKIEESYRRIREQVEGVTLAQEAMRGIILGSIDSWSDLGRMAEAVLRDIIARSYEAAAAGQGSFFGNLFGGIASALGFGGGAPPGRATGGPVWRGWQGMVGERGPEASAASSDGYVFDAVTTMAQLRRARGAAGALAGAAAGPVSVTINNLSSQPVDARARLAPGADGGSDLVVELTDQVERVVDRRVDAMFSGRDDVRFGAAFGLRRRLRGN